MSQDDVLFGGPAARLATHERVPCKMRVLVTVKAAPNPSATYGETVCVAGLRLDAGYEGWVRLYPINLRHIEENHTFKKYDVITLDARPAAEGRYESWRPVVPTVTRVGHLDGWDKRMPHLLPHTHVTMCELNGRAVDGGPSLGLVPAREVLGLDITPHPGWTTEEQQKINRYMMQGELFDEGRPKSALEPPRFKVSYRWRCPAPVCKGHQQGIIDWEMAAFQRQRLPVDEAAARAAITAKWLDQLCAPNREVFFYVGNLAKRHQTFSILGVVYPPR